MAYKCNVIFSLFSTEKPPDTSIKSETKDKNEQTKCVQGK